MIYVNIDLETTGMGSDRNAILSIGAVAHEDQDWKEIGKFYWKLQVPENRGWDADTLKWWETEPAALEEATTNAFNPRVVCRALLDWLIRLRGHPGKPGPFDNRIVFVANPTSFDLPFLRSYMAEYIGKEWEEFALANDNKLWLGGIDLSTLSMAIQGKPYPDARRKEGWRKEWKSETDAHNHTAIADARHQAFAFICMMQMIEEMRWVVGRENPGLLKEPT